MRKLCLMVCENFYQEAVAVVESAGLDVEVATCPVHCDSPQVGQAQVNQAIRVHQATGSQVSLVGARCLAETPDLGKVEPRHIHKLDQCFYMFASKEMVDAYIREGAYVLTPGWLAHWPQRIKRWGFDRPTARAFFRESANKLVLLDTGVGARRLDDLNEFADFVALPYQVVPVGLDFFRLFLTNVVLEWRLEEAHSESTAVATRANRQAADYAMMVDLIARLGRTMSEAESIESILDLFAMLLAPAELAYLSLIEGQPGPVTSRPALRANAQLTDLWAAHQDEAWTETEAGFTLRISYQNQALGMLIIEGVAFPEYKKHYLNLAINLVPVCGLAISNARIYQQLQETSDKLSEEDEQLKAALSQREWLVRDTYHRVKNNLLVIEILLKMQADEIQDPQLRKAFTESRTRVKSMLLIHEKLHQSRDLTQVDFAGYLRKLARALLDAYKTTPIPIELIVDVGNIFLSADMATSCGLIINELVSNALKHAFKGRQHGRLFVALAQEQKEYVLTVSDDGNGLPEDFDFKSTRSLGMQIVAMKVSDLEGKIHVERQGGTTWKVTFPTHAGDNLSGH